MHSLNTARITLRWKCYTNSLAFYILSPLLPQNPNAILRKPTGWLSYEVSTEFFMPHPINWAICYQCTTFNSLPLSWTGEIENFLLTINFCLFQCQLLYSWPSNTQGWLQTFAHRTLSCPSVLGALESYFLGKCEKMEHINLCHGRLLPSIPSQEKGERNKDSSSFKGSISHYDCTTQEIHTLNKLGLPPSALLQL